MCAHVIHAQITGAGITEALLNSWKEMDWPRALQSHGITKEIPRYFHDQQGFLFLCLRKNSTVSL